MDYVDKLRSTRCICVPNYSGLGRWIQIELQLFTPVNCICVDTVGTTKRWKKKFCAIFVPWILLCWWNKESPLSVHRTREGDSSMATTDDKELSQLTSSASSSLPPQKKKILLFQNVFIFSTFSPFGGFPYWTPEVIIGRKASGACRVFLTQCKLWTWNLYPSTLFFFFYKQGKLKLW